RRAVRELADRLHGDCLYGQRCRRRPTRISLSENHLHRLGGRMSPRQCNAVFNVEAMLALWWSHDTWPVLIISAALWLVEQVDGCHVRTQIVQFRSVSATW